MSKQKSLNHALSRASAAGGFVRVCAAGMMALSAPIALATPSFAATAAAEPSFESWKQSFRADAIAAGISPEVFDAALAGIHVDQKVFEANSNQPEFTRAIWQYLDSAVSATRVTNGRQKAADHAALLAQIETAYGVDKEILLAIWGMETSFGSFMGDHDAIRALATLAYRGRRTKFGRSQLLGALKIIQNGYATREQLKGSWAGAMGHTQFIPTTYLAYAVDYDGDGKRDIWSNLGDVFASTANYLSASKFTKGTPRFVEVRLSDDFNYALADGKTRKPIVEWAAMGISSATTTSLIGRIDPNARARLILPAGAKGPSFLVFGNFEAILKYNQSTAYALGVAMLAEEIANSADPLSQDWPRTDRPLARSERKLLQQELKDRGFNPGPVDGIIGAGTKAALRSWQKQQGIPADGYASAAALQALSLSPKPTAMQ